MVREGPAQAIFCLLTAPVDQNMQNNMNKTLYRTKNKVLLTALCYKILLYKIKCQFPVLLFTKIKTYIKHLANWDKVQIKWNINIRLKKSI